MTLPFKTVWVTGASSGIGRALALRLAREGCTVFASARSEDRLTKLAGEAEKLMGKIIPLPVDITDREAVIEAGKTMAKGGPLDLAVLNAGTYLPMSAAEFDSVAFKTQVDVNLTGTGHCLEAILPDFLGRKAGHIAVVSSVAGYCGLPTSAAYGATKAALINLAESLKFDLDPAGVKLQLVCPGFVKTPLTDKNEFPMPHLMPVDDAVDALLTGLKSDRFEITFPKRFTRQMKFLRAMPYGLFFWLAKRATKSR